MTYHTAAAGAHHHLQHHPMDTPFPHPSLAQSSNCRKTQQLSDSPKPFYPMRPPQTKVVCTGIEERRRCAHKNTSRLLGDSTVATHTYPKPPSAPHTLELNAMVCPAHQTLPPTNTPPPHTRLVAQATWHVLASQQHCISRDKL
jgi:hypothetical protein